MNIVVPDILIGGMGRAMQQMGQTIASSGAALGQTVGTAVKSISAQQEAYEKQQEYVRGTEMEAAMLREKQENQDDLARKLDPTDPMSAEIFRATDEAIGLKYIEQADNPKIAAYLQKSHYASQQNGQIIINGALDRGLRQRSSNATDQMMNNEIAQASKDLKPLEHAYNCAAFVETMRGYHGIETDAIKARVMSECVKRSVLGALGGEYGDTMGDIIDDPRRWEEIVRHIDPGGRASFEEEIARIRNNRKENFVYQSILQDAGGDIGKAAAAASRPETAALFALTEENHKNLLQKFDNEIGARDTRDRKTVGEAAPKLTGLYAAVDTGNLAAVDRRAIERILGNIEDPRLKIQLVNHWDRIFTELKASKQRERSGERAADPLSQGDSMVEAEYIQKSMKDPGKVNMNDVNLLLGNGISLDAYETIRDNVNEGAQGVWKTETGKYSQNLMETYLAARKFDPDEKENAAMFVNLQGYMKHYAAKNPEAKPADIRKIIDDYLQPHQEERIVELLNKLEGAFLK